MNELLRNRLALLDAIPDKFITQAQAAERKAITEILGLLGELEVKDGRIVNSAANYSKVDRIFAQGQKVFNEPYQKAVNEFLGGIDKVHALNVQYFGAQDITEEANYIIRHGKENALKVLAQGGMSGISQLRTTMDIAVSSGTTIPRLASQLRTFGVVSRHAKTFAVDLLTIIDRTYTTHIATQFGFEWFWYVGGIVKDSRCFCVDRHNKYYRKSEVEAWGENPSLWEGSGSTILGGVCKGGGRNPLTNSQTIFTLAGGYNCRHVIVPVSQSAIPKSLL